MAQVITDSQLDDAMKKAKAEAAVMMRILRVLRSVPQGKRAALLQAAVVLVQTDEGEGA